MEDRNALKIKKFELRLTETLRWFYPSPWYDEDYADMPFCLPIYDKEKISHYLENQYFKKIYDVCFLELSDYSSEEIKNMIRENKYNINGPDPEDLVCEIKKLKDIGEYECYYHESGEEISVETDKIRGTMVFLALLLASVDEEFYEEQISMVADLACIFEFTEDMMLDWTNAVKYFLDGNKFCANMKLEFKTLEANLFFKGIGEGDLIKAHKETFEGLLSIFSQK